MKTIRSSLVVTLALAGLFGASAASATEEGAANGACRQETKRVAVWPRTSPKAPQMARFEDRQVTVCDAKAAARRAADAQLQAKDTGN
ncbi:MAG TPA: hypothetical protein VIU34_14345 [Steroidobacter sp.]